MEAGIPRQTICMGKYGMCRTPILRLVLKGLTVSKPGKQSLNETTQEGTGGPDQLRHEVDSREHGMQDTSQDTEPSNNYDEFSDQDIADRGQEIETSDEDSMLKDDLLEAIRKKEEPERVDATRAADEADPQSDSNPAV